MWLQNEKQHAFPLKTTEDNFLPLAKAQLNKDFEYEQLNNKYDDEQKRDILSPLNCHITKI